MKLTPHIPLRLQHFEIGRRTLFAISITCLTFLFFCIHEEDTSQNAAIPVQMNIRQATDKSAVKPMSAAFIKNQPTKGTPKKVAKKVYHISSILAPEALLKRGIPENDIASMRLTCEKYVERYVRVALAEKEKFGIPASITLVSSAFLKGAKKGIAPITPMTTIKTFFGYILMYGRASEVTRNFCRKNGIGSALNLNKRTIRVGRGN